MCLDVGIEGALGVAMAAAMPSGRGEHLSVSRPEYRSQGNDDTDSRCAASGLCVVGRSKGNCPAAVVSDAGAGLCAVEPLHVTCV